MSKGSHQRPGTGYAQGWDAIFTHADASGKCPVCNENVDMCACKATEDGPGQDGDRPDYGYPKYWKGE